MLGLGEHRRVGYPPLIITTKDFQFQLRLACRFAGGGQTLVRVKLRGLMMAMASCLEAGVMTRLVSVISLVLSEEVLLTLPSLYTLFKGGSHIGPTSSFKRLYFMLIVV